MTSLTESPLEILIRLNRVLDYDQARHRKLDAYFHGRQPLSMLPESIREDCGDRLPQLRINFCRLIVDAVEERLDIEGFRLGDDSIDPDLLWMIWQTNGMDEASQLAHLEALVHGRAAIMVWADENGFPRITVESGRQCVVWQMPGSSHRIAALKRWIEPDGSAFCTLFQPHVITRWRTASKISLDPYLMPESMQTYGLDGYSYFDFSQLPSTGWELRAPPIPNPLGIVPVIPLINRPRLLNRGESELIDVLPLVDAINKLATDMMISAEYHSTPRRYATGIEVQTRVNADGVEEVIDPFSTLKGRNWLAESSETNFGQFPEATLDGFVNAITNLTQTIGAVSGLPPHYLGISREPSSADAIRSSEAPLVNAARRKQRQFGGAWEEALRLCVVILDGYMRPGLHSMSTVWGDAETRTRAQEADAATKLAQIGVPLEQLAQDLGYSPQEIQAMPSLQGPMPTANGQAPPAMTLPDAVETQRELRGDAERAR